MSLHPRRLNLRLMAFLCVIAIPFLWFSYVLVNQIVTGGG